MTELRLLQAFLVAAIPMKLALGLRPRQEDGFGVEVAMLEQKVAQKAQANKTAELEAERTFLETLGEWKFRRVEGPDVLHCSGQEYVFVRGLGSGAMGVTVVMARGRGGDAVVAKLEKKPGSDDLFKECDIMRRLEEKGVPNVLRCEAMCTWTETGQKIIVTTPYLPESTLHLGDLEAQDAQERAAIGTLLTARLMLQADVFNFDQKHNIIYTEEGTVLFIDFGIAIILDEKALSKSSLKWRLEIFVQDMTKKIPKSLFASEAVAEAAKMLEDEASRIIATMPHHPSEDSG